MMLVARQRSWLRLFSCGTVVVVLLLLLPLLLVCHAQPVVVAVDDDVLDLDRVVSDALLDGKVVVTEVPADDSIGKAKSPAAETLSSSNNIIMDEAEKKESSSSSSDEERFDIENNETTIATKATPSSSSSKEEDLQSSSTAGNSSASNSNSNADESSVSMIRPDLLLLTDDELSSICMERGFEIRKKPGDPGGTSSSSSSSSLTRQDLLQAAMRCIQLEEEMNVALQDHPELAMELETEIERMKHEKERLETQQAEMLREKALLEQQLRKAGIDLSGIIKSDNASSGGGTLLSAVVPRNDDGTTTSPPESLEDVLRTSFTMLFDRVGRDMMLVGNVFGFVVLRPTAACWTMAWPYLGPTVEGLVQQVWRVADQVVSTKPVIVFRTRIMGRLLQDTTILPMTRPLLHQTRSILRMGWKQLDSIEYIHQGTVVAGAVLGPLGDSLLIGWRHALQPKLAVARRKAGVWLQRVRQEMKAQQLVVQQQQQQEEENA